MVFNISLTTESDTADTVAAEFVDILSARSFTAEEKERRSNYGSKVYILYTVTPCGLPSTHPINYRYRAAN